MNYGYHRGLRFIRTRLPLSPVMAECFECHRIFASRSEGRRASVLRSCVAQRQHGTQSREPSRNSTGETRTSRIPFTLGNPRGYQLPEIPHTYSRESRCAPRCPLHISEVVLRSSRCGGRVRFRWLIRDIPINARVFYSRSRGRSMARRETENARCERDNSARQTSQERDTGRSLECVAHHLLHGLNNSDELPAHNPRSIDRTRERERRRRRLRKYERHYNASLWAT